MHRLTLLMLMLILALFVLGCGPKGIPVSKRTEISFKTEDGACKAAITCSSQSGQAAFIIENLGEREIFLTKEQFFFADASDKIIGQMGTGWGSNFSGPNFRPTMNITVSIGSKLAYRLRIPDNTQSIIVREIEKSNELFRMNVK